ncbi:response regulator transcription factor [Bacteroides helcogenes]|uniref:Transcriptional regulator n=1 Tax=Bacteroides helcogenes (strain ATCC 35417 / DSM 20613 / JCM 6297 / CCUG 15421 / P 36-108) TaxID=693979 RepID=E6SUL4_BACT6|nr:LuxR C-terminal-related transcriptional regulator [Bacteroides helcogenes]ADV43378.1 transcriptional regulator [Bacteroides helcogenes P 36-108]MDY5238146.1 LuxR C-terminal-related transcriptional regulator [Bacteroides helcogenes]
MNNNTSLKIVVAETSVIIRSGLTAVLKRIPNLNAHPIEVSSPESLQNYIHMHPADIIIVNPTFGGWFDLSAFKAENKKSGIRYIALVCSVIDNNTLKEYDENFAICDDVDSITSKINHLLHTEEEEEEKDNEQECLSQREREIITCVVKGMTNKAIADKLYLSIHTVITHRRNIARKLQIHSPAGLTIYAIVNKLVELSDIKDTL